MDLRRIILFLTLVSTISSATSALAELKLKGLIRFGYDISDSEVFYEEHVNDEGTYADSSGGLNFSTDLVDNWTVAGQLFTHHGGELEWLPEKCVISHKDLQRQPGKSRC